MLQGEPLRVLLVDDDPTTADPVADCLATKGSFSLTHAPSVGDAQTALSIGEFDAVVLSLPRGDQNPLCAFALLQAAAPQLPIVVISEETGENIALKAIHQGASDYLIRSRIYDTVLVRCVRHAIEKRRMHDAGTAAHEALRASEARYRSLFTNSRDAIFVTDHSGVLLEVNAAMLELLGHEQADIIGLAVTSLFVDPADRIALTHELHAGRPIHDLEVRLQRKDGGVAWCLISVVETNGAHPEGPGYQGIIHDITDRKRAEERLLHNAYHDVLTGLPNRALFSDRLERAIARFRRHEEQRFSVLFIDLDRFKIVNDSLGHSVGDDLLKKLGSLISECLRDEDTVARLGGDEFAILMERTQSAAEATVVAERIHRRLETPLVVGTQNVFASCSIGIVVANDPEAKPEDMLRNADIAMYKSKAAGRGETTIYSEGMHSIAVSLMELDMELHEAVRNREFVLHYQPIFSMGPGQALCGFEALVRWQNPRRGLLSPQEFLPLAEETGLILPIGRQVIQKACAQMAAWQKLWPAKELPFISLNIAGPQLTQPGFIADTARILRDAGVDPSTIMFELTETSLLHNPDACAVTIRKMRALGFRFCIDDFGTGYSSLSYLHRLPINGLKIDRSFISALDRGESQEVVSTIVSLAHSLGIYAIAEGVETEAQLASVRALGPQYVQGFLLSKPLEPAAAQNIVTWAA